MIKIDKKYSPCIISWARYALEIKTKAPMNNKKCSERYWRKIIDCLIILNPGKKVNKTKAYNSYRFVKK
jgi:hypothetical protein